MKTLFAITPFILALALPASSQTQDERDKRWQEEQGQRFEEAMAGDRITAARKLVPVTTKQCQADLASWLTRDEEDNRKKIDADNYWFQNVSSEELVRMTSEALSCKSRKVSRLPRDRAAFTNFQVSFLFELLSRAEAILRRHHFMKEYSLERASTRGLKNLSRISFCRVSIKPCASRAPAAARKEVL